LAPISEARVGPGEAIIHSLNEITCSRAPQRFRGVWLRIARKTARSVAPDPERRLAPPAPTPLALEAPVAERLGNGAASD
jgi:hypothetical protein